LLASFPSVKKKSRSAFSLVEVTLALGVAAFCFVTVAGLLSVGLQTNQRSTSQTAATNIIAAVVTDLRSTAKVAALGQSPSGSSPQFQIPVSGGPPQTIYFDGSGYKTTLASTQFPAVYRLKVTITNPTAATFAQLQVTWPAVVDPADPTTGTPAGSVETFAAFDLHK
jgi:uncharacterized protein (TIGR02598 family)